MVVVVANEPMPSVSKKLVKKPTSGVQPLEQRRRRAAAPRSCAIQNSDEGRREGQQQREQQDFRIGHQAPSP